MKALDGISVLEFASYVSGPYAGMMLADLGAEVIKIEPPDGGDPFRGWGAADYSATFGSVNRNKKSIVLDLKSEDGAEPDQSAADLHLDHRLRAERPLCRARRLRHGRPGDERALERADQSRRAGADGHFALRSSHRHDSGVWHLGCADGA